MLSNKKSKKKLIKFSYFIENFIKLEIGFGILNPYCKNLIYKIKKILFKITLNTKKNLSKTKSQIEYSLIIVFPQLY